MPVSKHRAKADESGELHEVSVQEILELADATKLRIGRELHDSVGQLLTGLSMLHRTLVNSLVRKGLPEAQHAQHEAELLDQLRRELRRIMRGLQPIGEEPEALETSLEDLAAAVLEEQGVPCEICCDHKGIPPDHGIRAQLYALAQALIECALHSRGIRAIRITLDRAKLSIGLELTGEVDGMQKVREIAECASYRTSEVRARVIGARLNVSHAPPLGVLVTCDLPGSTC